MAKTTPAPEEAEDLSREDLLGMVPQVEVVVVRWKGRKPGRVWVHQLNLMERLNAHAESKKSKASFIACVMAASIRDKDGKRLLKPEDAEKLDGLAYGPMAPLGVAATRLNGLNEEAEDEAAKKSSASPT